MTGGVIPVFVEVKEMPAEVPRGSSAGVFMLQSSLEVILRDQSCTMIISVSLGSDPTERLRSLTFLQDTWIKQSLQKISGMVCWMNERLTD